MRYFVLSLLVGLLPSLVFAQACPTNSSTSNLTQPPGTLAQLPAMNQGSTGLCYAFTVSQLVDARRFTNPANRSKRISPLALGMLTPQANNFLNRSRLDDGGSVKGALDTLLRPGTPVCSQRHVSRLYGDTDDQFTVFGTMEMMFKQIREAYYTPCNCTASARRQDALSNIQEMRTFMTSRSLLEGTPSEGVNPFLADLAAIIVRLNDLPPSAFANYNDSFNSRLLLPYFNRLCRGHTISVPALRLNGLRAADKELNSGLTPVPNGTAQITHFSNHAWNILAQPSAQPLGINFCSAMLTGSSTFVSPNISGNQCKNHAAVLAGQRCRGGRRQFLLRNSWGEDCGDLAPRHRANCDGRGNLWVDGENLMRSTYSLYQTVP